jgi:stage II sporulation protein M
MPIIACPECKGQLSDQAPACPHCGYVAKPPPATAKPSPILKLVSYFKPDVSRLWKDCKRSFGILGLVLLVTMVVGVIIGSILGRDSQREVFKFIQKSMGSREDVGFLDLFIHNLTVALMILGAGLWLRGLPGFIIGVNGFAAGFVVAVAAGASGVGVIATLLLLLPHGIFELPALVGSGGLALRVNSWKLLKPDEKVQPEDVRWIARCFGIIAILFVVAATIEAALIAGMSPKNPWR